jgi:hypothetical protein
MQFDYSGDKYLHILDFINEELKSVGSPGAGAHH